MKTLPIRFFHAILSGLVLGSLLTVGWMQVSQNLAANPIDENPVGDSVDPAPIPPVDGEPAPDDAPNPADPDGDGIPSAWEAGFHHDSESAADAGTDFDNDGLTASEEYQLHTRTSGASGNPLGRWAVETVESAISADVAWMWPVDMNNRGELIINASLIENEIWRDTAFLIDVNREWNEIQPTAAPDGGYLWANDLNDKGEVVGSRYSADWTEYGSYIWDKTAGYRPFKFKGLNADVWKINNFGAWIGSTEDPNGGGMMPAFVVDGVNLHSPGDWWPYVSFSDLNDFGEAMGSFYSPGTGRNHTFLAHGDWRFDTGLLGGVPLFDQDTWSWSWSSAMNAYGEFAGGAGGQRDNLWTYLGFHFDGEFNEIKFAGRELDYLAPQSLNSSSTIVGYARDRSGHWGGFVHHDQVGVFLDELLPQSGARYVSKINDKGQMIAVSSNQNQIFVISPDQDQDGDGMADDWEDFHGLDKSFAGDANQDADTDGTNNFGEFLLRSNPNAPPVLDPDGDEIDTRPGIDTDGDGLPNVWEWENGLNYEDASDATLDFDRDGYTNLQEFRLRTDPRGAPSFRIREVGPFPGAASISLSSATLGDGVTGSEVAGHVGNNIAESVFFNARPALSADGGQRPAQWSILRSNAAGSFSWVTTHGSQYTYPVLQSPGGAFLSQTYGNPNQFYYWSTPTATPVGLSGAAGAHDIGYLHNARFSPSGTYLVATRTLSGNSSAYQPILWKMPLSGSTTFTPVRLIAPAGAAISDWATLYVNDQGYVTATGSVAGQSRPILWKPNANGISMSASILPPLSGGTWTTVAGISNDASPIVCGTSATSGGRQRATVWSAAGLATDLGTLVGGNQSVATAVSRGGVVAGHSNVLVGNTLKYQPFLATYDVNSSKWHLKGQGDPVSNVPSIQSVNDSGEILGRIIEYIPTYRQIPTLWRHGRAYPLHTLIPSGSGHTLDSVSALNPHGTLLATTWRDGARTTILLTPDSDTDGDGLPDAFENEHSFNTFAANNPASDSDSDGLSDLDEYRNGTNPRSQDTDADGMNDGWEISWGLLPLDPTDAVLDPDSDRVTNLRESQIGTTPTGIYKVETRVIESDGSSPTFVAADDSGRLIHTGPYQYNYETDESGFQIESYQQDYHAQSPIPSSGVESIALPSTTYYTRYNSDWSEYSYRYDSPTYWPDPVSGRIHGVMQRSTWTYDGYNYNGDDGFYLIPDAENSPDESSWIPWNMVEESLKLGDSPPLSNDDSLSPWPISVSRSGTRRLHTSSGSGSQMIIDHSGELVRTLPNSLTWQLVNDLGEAVALTIRRIPAANGLPTYNTPELRLNAGGANITTHAIPNEPGLSPAYSLLGFSEDRKILLSRNERNHQMTNTTRHYLFDIHTGKLQRIRQPGIGSESIFSLSAENGRLLGSGTKPFQIAPDGTCIRLGALRIKNAPDEQPTAFGSLYPMPPSSNHISANGRITLTSSDAQYQTTILQTVPHNDMDADGMGDDWEASEIRYLVENDPDAWSHLSNTQDLDPNINYWNRGHNALQSFLLGLNFLDREISTSRDADGDNVADAHDGDPLDNVIDWRKTSEPRWFLIDLNIEVDDSKVLSDVSENGSVLIHTTNGTTPDDDIFVDRMQQIYHVPQMPENPLVEMQNGVFYARVANRLIGDRMLGVRSPGPVRAHYDTLWDPLSTSGSQYTIYELDCYADDILDSPGNFQVRRKYEPLTGNNLWTPSGWLMDSYDIWWDVRIESNGNVVAPLGTGQVGYWIYDRAEGGYSPPIKTTLALDQLYSSGESSTLEQPKSSFEFTNMYEKWHAITEKVVRISRQGGAFRQTSIGKDLTPSFVGAGPGWFMANTNQNSQSTMLWCNGVWKDLRDLTGRIGDDKPSSFRVKKIRDNGVGVAEVKRPGRSPTFMLMMPVEVVELLPKLVDERDQQIIASENAIPLPASNPMVERDPSSEITDASTQRIAWRDIKLKVAKVLAGRSVKWSMTPQFIPKNEDGTDESHPRFRGKWGTAENTAFRHRFSESREYLGYDCEQMTILGESETYANVYTEATTRVDEDGYTAIRVNIPPIGFNKARITVRIDGVDTDLDLLDLEVPAVVVIDPGHGIGAAGGSNAIGGSGVKTGVLEHEFALDIANRMVADLEKNEHEEKRLINVFMTRKDTRNVSFPERTGVARENGCDIYVSIHFNSVDGVPLRRHPFGMWDSTGNYNLAEDMALAVRLRKAVQSAIFSVEPDDSRNSTTDGVTSETHELNLQKGLDTCSDSTSGPKLNYNGNMLGYTPCRATLIELEWMSNVKADLLFNEKNIRLSATASSMREKAAQAMAKAAIQDLHIQPKQ